MNITDFRGISQSDNPFILDYKTASDSLNVYVDESNTLTTRPRLELMLGKEWVSNMTKFYGLYPISLGYLLHCQISGSTNILYLIRRVGNEFTRVSIDNPDKISYGDSDLIVFEQDDSVYVLTEEYYCVIVPPKQDGDVAEMRRVIPYIPTTAVNGVGYESVNILTNKHKELFFWDGTTDPNLNKKDPSDIVDNKYLDYKKTALDYKVIKCVGDTIKENNTGSLEGIGFFGVDSGEVFIKTQRGETVYEQRFSPSVDVVEKALWWGDCSFDGNVLILHGVDLGTPYTKGDATYAYRQDTGKWYVLGSEQTTITQACTMTAWGIDYVPLKTSRDGSCVCYLSSDPKDEDSAVLRFFIWDPSQDRYIEKIKPLAGVDGPGWGDEVYFEFSPDGQSLLLCLYEFGKEPCWQVKLIIDVKTNPDGAGGEIAYPTKLSSVKAALSDTDCVIYSTSDVVVWKHYRTENRAIVDFGEMSEILSTAKQLTISRDGGYLYSVGEKIHRISLTNKFVIDMGEGVSSRDRLMSIDGLDKSLVIVNRLKLLSSANETTVIRSYIKTTTEPLLTVTGTIQNDTAVKFAGGSFTFRFDGNRWFVNGARLLRTENNDPTYIPETHVALLGETDENITGYNIVQDDLCVVYKDNRLYSISPHTYTDVSGTEIQDYVYRETKNTVGNNASGAAIVSAYTEQPLQITYDGVYALKQLTNVYASDRISESISDDIAAKWLKESRDSIRNAKTINRLYWTYFTLTEEDKSKVYLLDNRTTSWFYWEFPIVIKNIFVKNNVVELTDIDGNFYQLTTKDIYRNYKTEYYDDGKRIIDWYWKSQILPLGTMNYSKKLIDTTFIFTDTDDNDAYGLTYTFNAYRKVVSKTNETTITNNLSYVQSTTKKTLIPRCNFIQLELSNVADSFDHNKLRLVGLGLKYVLLEGLL